MNADLLIQNGCVVDPSRGINRVETVAIKGKRIIPYEQGMTAAHTINAEGCFVTPGLIDSHAHIFERGTDSGIAPDLSMLPQGVTTVVDAGSAGVSTYRSFLDRLALCRIKTKFYLHISPTGQVTHQYPESLRPDRWNISKFEEAVEICGNRMLGLKLRISRNVVGSDGLYHLKKAVELGERLGRRVVVHVTDPAATQAEVAALLRPGDVFCHVYHGRGHTILENGVIPQAIWDARERGVIFDCCHGSINFNFDVAEAALAQGFPPDVITSDMNSVTWCKPPLFHLTTVMSKFLMMGMPLEDVISCVTHAPAKLIGEEAQLGTLRPDTCADIALLKLVQQPTRFIDAEGNQRQGRQLLRTMATILDGVLVYRAQDLCF